MKIFGIAIVKNESDIIVPFLDHVRGWADRVFVYDNGSTDGTWEKVKVQADDVVVPWKREDVPFFNGLRSRVYHAFCHEAGPGDWWCYRMDADEFYLDNPREFLSNVPRRYHTVAKKSANYLVTAEDLQEHTFTGDFASDRAKLSYMKPYMSIEKRFFRHRDGIIWQEGGRRTYNGITYPHMITVKHFQWRSPQQIQRRLETKHEYLQRKAVWKGRATQEQINTNPPSPDAWKAYCPPRSHCVLDDGPGSFQRLTFNERALRRTHESRYSYYKKRLLYLLRLRK